jgi:hypothetical protein
MSYYMDFQITVAALIIGIGLVVAVIRWFIART